MIRIDIRRKEWSQEERSLGEIHVNKSNKCPDLVIGFHFSKSAWIREWSLTSKWSMIRTFETKHKPQPQLQTLIFTFTDQYDLLLDVKTSIKNLTLLEVNTRKNFHSLFISKAYMKIIRNVLIITNWMHNYTQFS